MAHNEFGKVQRSTRDSESQEAGWLVEAETDLSVSQFLPRISRMPIFEFRECVRERERSEKSKLVSRFNSGAGDRVA